MFSFSKLKLFNQCPLQFKFRYIDKLPAIKTPQLQKGTDVHSLLEKYQQSDFNISSHSAEVQQIFNNFINSELGQDILKYNSVREYRFYLDKDLEPCEKENAQFIGFIDRINKVNDKIEIIDYKTGKYVEQQFQDFEQLITYAIYVLKKYKNLNEVTLRFIYVEHCRENSLIFKRESLDFYAEKLKKNIQVINECIESNNYIKTPSHLCPWCSYKKQCDMLK